MLSQIDTYKRDGLQFSCPVASTNNEVQNSYIVIYFYKDGLGYIEKFFLKPLQLKN